MISSRPASDASPRRLRLGQRAELAILDTGTVAEALVALAAARFCVHFCFRRIASWALRVRPADAPVPHPHLDLRVGRSIARAAHLLPGSSLCLPQAIAAKWMMERRGYPVTIHLGAGTNGGARLHAHAWSEAGGAILTGASEIASVTHIERSARP